MEDFEQARMTGHDWAHDFLETVRADPSKLNDDSYTAQWFANAINMARFEDSQADKLRADHLSRELRTMAYYISHHCHRNPMPVMDLVTPLEIALEGVLSSDRSMLSFIREHMVRLDAGEVKA